MWLYPAMLIQMLILAAAAALSFAVAWLIMRNAAQLGVVQSPNARSSHTRPTPGGGGVGIVAGSTLALGWTIVSSPWPIVVVLLCALLIAGIGFYDDRTGLPASFRLLAQFVLTGVAIVVAIPAEALAAAIGLPMPGLVAICAAVVVAVYWINLFNFMDGIDGIAGAQAIFMTAGAALLLATLPGTTANPQFWMPLGIAAATAGFLMLNWPPAKIFMGDAGSTFLGFIIALLALLTIASGALSLAQWVILAAAFVVDATVTLARRLMLRERVFEAHRRHAYQRLSRRWGGHLPVTLTFIAINLIWLLPLAYVAALPGWGLPAIALAYLPLTAAAIVVGAGAPETATR
ncbi:MAG: glycosyltransferase family 4 protein [Devosia sp.]